jgi:hypothetical protein
VIDDTLEKERAHCVRGAIRDVRDDSGVWFGPIEGLIERRDRSHEGLGHRPVRLEKEGQTRFELDPHGARVAIAALHDYACGVYSHAVMAAVRPIVSISNPSSAKDHVRP